MALPNDEAGRQHVLSLYRDGATLDELAAELHVATPTMSAWLHRNCDDMRSAHETHELRRRQRLEATLPPYQMVCRECGGVEPRNALGVCADCQRPGYIADIDREFEDQWLLRNARKVRP